MKKQHSKVLMSGSLAVVVAALAIFACGSKPDGSGTETVDSLVSRIDSAAFNFDDDLLLRVRYPKLFSDPSFVEWKRTRTISDWHETELIENRRQVIVQSAETGSVYAFDVTNPLDSDLVIRDTARFEFKNLHFDSVATAFPFPDIDSNATLKALRPKVIFGPQKQLLWEVEFQKKDSSLKLFEIDFKTNKIIKNTTRSMGLGATTPTPPVGGDELASNELHHPSSFRTEAMQWTQGASTVKEKCRIIFAKMNEKYRYDSNILGVTELTWSDLLTRDINQRAGICDEWAVIQISYLRSLGIPAVIKFVAFNGSAHALVEYKDGANWYHMDALWKAFNQKGVYQASSPAGTKVWVMDGSHPLDSRYSGDAFGIMDQLNDSKLHPYNDYITTVPDTRPGYN